MGSVNDQSPWHPSGKQYSKREPLKGDKPAG